MMNIEQKRDNDSKDEKEKVYSSLSGIVIEVEGNIGSGKSTLVSNMKLEIDSQNTGATMNNINNSNNKVSVSSEYVNEQFLKAFYESPKQYALPFQLFMLAKRLNDVKDAHRLATIENKCVLLDRGPIGDLMFALLSNLLKTISDPSIEIYASICCDQYPSKQTLSDCIDVFVYLYTDPETCYTRMNKHRKRESERGVSLDYLERVDTMYFDMICLWMGGCVEKLYNKGLDFNVGQIPPPILVIPWSKFGNVYEDVLKPIYLLRTGKVTPARVEFKLNQTPAVEMLNKEEKKDKSTSASSISSRSTTITTQRTQRPILLENIYSMNDFYEHHNNDNFEEVSDTTRLIINWNIPHNNKFKKVVMMALARRCHIVFVLPATPELTSNSTELSLTSSTKSRNNMTFVLLCFVCLALIIVHNLY